MAKAFRKFVGSHTEKAYNNGRLTALYGCDRINGGAFYSKAERDAYDRGYSNGLEENKNVANRARNNA